jgi:hypothetical protein
MKSKTRLGQPLIALFSHNKIQQIQYQLFLPIVISNKTWLHPHENSHILNQYLPKSYLINRNLLSVGPKFDPQIGYIPVAGFAKLF